MKANLNLGSVSGIKIIIHWTFFLLIIWVVYNEINQGGTFVSIIYNIVFVLAVFLCVVLHELGHALTAKHYGINTKKITLLPIGGMASLDRIPESPKQELVVTLAGPLVNIVIALLLYFIMPVNEYLETLSSASLEAVQILTIQNFLFYLFLVNVALVVFNFIPAFPMDGGRILRALLAMKIDRVKATQIASVIGQIIAVFFLLIGLLYNPFLIFIALIVFLGAAGENQMVQHLAVLKGHRVKEAMLTNITTFSPKDRLKDVVNTLLSGNEKNFIVIEDHRILGLILHKDIIEKSNIEKILVKDVMHTTFKTVDSNADLKNTYRLIRSEKKPFFPVVENGKLVGAIDAINLNEFIMVQAKLGY